MWGRPGTDLGIRSLTRHMRDVPGVGRLRGLRWWCSGASAEPYHPLWKCLSSYPEIQGNPIYAPSTILWLYLYPSHSRWLSADMIRWTVDGWPVPITWPSIVWLYPSDGMVRSPTALIDSGATENFMNLTYAKWLRLPIKRLAKPWKLFNVDGTENKSGELQFYTDLQVWMGTTSVTLRFFLSDLGKHKAILGYPWFTAT